MVVALFVLVAVAVFVLVLVAVVVALFVLVAVAVFAFVLVAVAVFAFVLVTVAVFVLVLVAVAVFILLVVVALFVLVLVAVVVALLVLVVVAVFVLVAVAVAFLFLVVATLERADARRGDHEVGVIRQVLEDGPEGAFLEVVAVDDHQVGGCDVADVGGRGAEGVSVRARRDHGHDVGVVPGDLLGEVGDNAGGCDHLEPFVGSCHGRRLAGGGGVAVIVVSIGARCRNGEREREKERRPERSEREQASHHNPVSDTLYRFGALSRLIRGTIPRISEARKIPDLNVFPRLPGVRTASRSVPQTWPLVAAELLGAARAEPVDLEAVAVDVEAALAPHLGELVLDSGAGEVVGRAALGANQVVVVSRVVGEAVTDCAVIEHYLAEYADFLEQPHRAEHGGATDAGGGLHDVVGGEVIAEVAHHLDQLAARFGEAAAAVGDASFERPCGNHCNPSCRAPGAPTKAMVLCAP